MPAKSSKLKDRNPFHFRYKDDRQLQSKIIFERLRFELFRGTPLSKLPLAKRVSLSAAAILIMELHCLETAYLNSKKPMAKEYPSILNTLRNTLNQLKPAGRQGKPAKVSDSLNLSDIVNGGD